MVDVTVSSAVDTFLQADDQAEMKDAVNSDFIVTQSDGTTTGYATLTLALAAAGDGDKIDFPENAVIEGQDFTCSNSVEIRGNGSTINVVASHDWILSIGNTGKTTSIYDLTLDGGDERAIAASGRQEGLRVTGQKATIVNCHVQNVGVPNAGTGAFTIYVNDYLAESCSVLNPGYSAFRDIGEGTRVKGHVVNLDVSITKDKIAGGGQNRFFTCLRGGGSLHISGGRWITSISNTDVVFDPASGTLDYLSIADLSIHWEATSNDTNLRNIKFSDCGDVVLSNIAEYCDSANSTYSWNLTSANNVTFTECQLASYINILGSVDRLTISDSTFGRDGATAMAYALYGIDNVSHLHMDNVLFTNTVQGFFHGSLTPNRST